MKKINPKNQDALSVGVEGGGSHTLEDHYTHSRSPRSHPHSPPQSHPWIPSLPPMVVQKK